MDLSLYGVNLWAGMLLFARIGAMVMLLPGIGEAATPASARLGFAVLFTALLAPGLQHLAPLMPDQVTALAGMVVSEILIGIMFGAAARLLVSSLATAGEIMGLETGLAFAQTSDPTQDQAGQIFGVFLTVMGVALMFATGLVGMFVRGVAGTYDLVGLGAAVPVDDGAMMAVDAVAVSFRVGFQLATPIIVGGLMFRVGLGVLTRLIPQIQAFFVVLPLQLLGGFMIIALGLSTGMLVWLDSLDRFADWLR